mgnify:CR=1 FL=1
MEHSHFLKLTIALSIVIMIVSFVVIPDTYPWYYDVLLFNLGLWPWLFAKRELKKIETTN